MTINLANNNPRIEYSVAQGATQQTFAVPFEFFNDSDITVYVDGVLKAEGADYTLTGGDGSTGNVVFVTATPPAVQQVLGATGGSTVVIFRTTDIERTSDFSAGSDINRAALNEQLDILTAMIADQNDKTDRTIRLNDYEIAPSLILPSIADRKGKVLAFNTTTGAVEEGPTTDSIINVNTYVATASAAATSATASAASAAASLDSFDDRYLGSKTSDPTLDNDGNALLTGALYYDSVNLLMKVYTGSGWSSLLTTGSTITANSSTPALTVTQLGSGTAFLVEDATSPDTTPFIVTADGSVGIGTQFPGAAFNVYNATSTIAQVTGDNFVTLNLSRAFSGFGSANLSFRKYRGTIGSPLVVNSGDALGSTQYSGYDGATLRNVSQIEGLVDTFTAADNISGFLRFSTRPTGLAAALAERLRIASAGQIGIGGANYGTSGQTIVSGGSAAAPAWGTLPVSGGGTGVTTSTGTGSTVLSNSPALAGTPTAPTAAAGTNTTQIATTAFALANSTGKTLLGTLTMTSGSTQTLSGLTLTSYKQIVFEFFNVGHNSGTTQTYSIGAGLAVTGVTASDFSWGLATVSLVSGVASTTLVRGNALPRSVENSTQVSQTGYSTATTSVSVSVSGGAFDSGSITIYGVK